MSTQNIVLGRGKLYFDQYAAGTTTLTGERYIGSTTAFAINVTSNMLDHFSMENAIKTNDKSVLLDVNRAGSFTTDNVDSANLAYFLIGDASALTVAGGAVTGSAINDIKQDRYYQIGATTANPTGARKLSAVVVKKGATTAVLNTDYTLDADLGRIYIKPGSLVLLDGDDITVDYTQAAHTRAQVVTSDTKIEGALRFISANAQGDQRDFYMPYAVLSPNGDLTLKGDDWQTLAFNLKVMEKGDGSAAIYADGRAI